MSSPITNFAGLYLQADNPAQDPLHILDKSGNVIGWIDSNGFLQGSLLQAVETIAPTIAVVTLSSAQLKALSVTPAIIVPAPGPGKYIVPQVFSFQLKYGGTPYAIANSGAGNTYVYWAGLGSGSAGSTATGIIPDSAGNGGMDYTANESELFIFPSLTAASISSDQILNQPLVVGMDDALSLGNSTMLITLSYTIITQ